MSRIYGMVPGLKYGDSAARLWVSLIKDAAAAVPDAETTPTVTVYDPAGVSRISATSLTQYSTTQWWYADLDISDTSIFDYNFGYRAALSWVQDSKTCTDNSWFDVVAWPINEPLITGDEIAARKPMWAQMLPAAVSTYVDAIKTVHGELVNDLRNLRTANGKRVYANRILNREDLRAVEIARAEAYIARYILAFPEGEHDNVHALEALANSAWAAFKKIILDQDDDLVADSDEEQMTGPTFEF